MKQFYYSTNNEQLGPISLEELKKQKITRGTKIWHEGLEDWKNASEIEELKDYFKTIPPPLLPDERKKPPALPNEKRESSSQLPKDSNGSTQQITLESKPILKNFHDEFRKKYIYHSQRNFTHNIKTEIGYIKKFELKWLATQLNTFIVIGVSETSITEQLINDFSDEAFSFAKKNNQGLPRGLQSGIGVIAVLIGESANYESKKYCLKLSKHFCAFKIPIIVDLSNKEIVHFKETPIWGKIYFPYFKKLISEIVKKELIIHYPSLK